MTQDRDPPSEALRSHNRVAGLSETLDLTFYVLDMLLSPLAADYQTGRVGAP